MSTLRELRDQGWGLTIYCEPSEGAFCTHSWTVNWDQLIQYFGYDFEPDVHRDEFLGRLKCERCGRKCATTRWQPPDRRGYLMRGMGSHNHVDTRTTAEKEEDQRLAAMVALRTAEQVNQAQAQRKANKAAEQAKRYRESGRDPIGPPNPWARRKKGRWL